MKFVHAADLHLDSPLVGLEQYEGAPVELIRGATRKALENLVDLATREGVDFVVIAGDLYDGDWRDFNTGMFFIRQMARLVDAGIRVYLIAGNHDAASTMTRKLRLPLNPGGDSLMISHEQPETRRLDDLGVAIHGRSFANQSEIKNMVPDYPAPISHWFNLGLLHTSLNGSEEHDTYAPCTPSDLKSKGYDYWALGHIHKRSMLPTEGVPITSPPALYSGNIQGRHIRESGPRGCFLVTTDECHRTEVQFHALDVFRWHNCTVPCDDLANSDEVLERFQDELRALFTKADGRPLGLRVRLAGSCVAHQGLVSHREAITAEIRSIAAIASEGRAWVEQVKFGTCYPPEKNILSGGDGPLAELERFLDSLPDDEEGLRRLTGELKDLAHKLPAELTQVPGGLLVDNIDWVREIVRDLKPMLLDRLQR